MVSGCTVSGTQRDIEAMFVSWTVFFSLSYSEGEAAPKLSTFPLSSTETLSLSLFF